jgi:ribonuclease HI
MGPLREILAQLVLEKSSETTQGKSNTSERGFMGHDTNNSVELWGLIKGIQLASFLNLQPLIIEGDSKVIISLATKIINGTDPEKITPSWRLLGPLSFLQALLHPPSLSSLHT